MSIATDTLTDTLTDATPATTPALRAGAFGNATGLACRECGHEVELGPHYACPECFGPLEVAYDFPEVTSSGPKHSGHA